MLYQTWLCPPQGGCGSHFCKSLAAKGGPRISPQPDQGTSMYAYDALGELRAQTDARGVITSLTGRDKLRCMTARTFTPPGVVPADLSPLAFLDTWTYDRPTRSASSTRPPASVAFRPTMPRCGRNRRPTTRPAKPAADAEHHDHRRQCHSAELFLELRRLWSTADCDGIPEPPRNRRSVKRRAHFLTGLPDPTDHKAHGLRHPAPR